MGVEFGEVGGEEVVGGLGVGDDGDSDAAHEVHGGGVGVRLGGGERGGLGGGGGGGEEGEKECDGGEGGGHGLGSGVSHRRNSR